MLADRINTGTDSTEDVQLSKEKAMYGRHYKAFRDSRRSEKAANIFYLKFNQQDFYSLLDECDLKRRAFSDRSFPPDISSICYVPFRTRSDMMAAADNRVRTDSATCSRASSQLGSYSEKGSESLTLKGDNLPKVGNIEWLRPKELNPRTRLLSGGKMFRGDLLEGQRGSANFAAASAALALKHELLFQVMPDDQCPIAFEDDWGIYKFRFWRYGNWTEVTIDDKLPSIGGELLFCHSEENDEHWMCVMEKAYAKFNGCYDVINHVPLSDMLQHMTGGVTETLKINSAVVSDGLGNYLESSFKKRALMLAVAVKCKQSTTLGLESDFPYIITRIKRANRRHPFLACLYSPFGFSDWRGPWGRESPEWRTFTRDEMYSYSLLNESEFDFWVSLEDMCEYFSTIYISHQSSDRLDPGLSTDINLSVLDPTLSAMVRCGMYGNWVRDRSDGGAPNNPKFLTHNAQYLITQQHCDEDTCLVSLVQRFRPRSTPHEGYMCIGFVVFKAPENIQYRMTDLKDSPIAIATYSYNESVTLKMNLPAGNYVIIPTSYTPGVVGEYLLRIVSAKDLNLRTLKIAPPSYTKKQMVDVELIAAENLPDPTHSYDADPSQEVYCIIQCGKESCTVPIKHGANPIWNCHATFFTKQPYSKTIKVQVWYKSLSEARNKEDILLAESCELPIQPGDHKANSQLRYGPDVTRSVLLPKKKMARCAGSVILIVRYNPLPTINRGNTRAMSVDRIARERDASLQSLAHSGLVNSDKTLPRELAQGSPYMTMRSDLQTL